MRSGILACAFGQAVASILGLPRSGLPMPLTLRQGAICRDSMILMLSGTSRIQHRHWPARIQPGWFSKGIVALQRLRDFGSCEPKQCWREPGAFANSWEALRESGSQSRG
jgi:hypothetical protein